jgi:hypothetical protein
VRILRGVVLWWPLNEITRDIIFLVSRHTFMKEENMDHNEALRKFEHLIIREADHAHEAATELEALVPLLPSEKSRQLARLQVKASHKLAKDLRELAQKARETERPVRFAARKSIILLASPTGFEPVLPP